MDVESGLVAGLSRVDLPVIAGGRIVNDGTIELPAQGALVLA